MKYLKEVQSNELTYEAWTRDDSALINEFKWKIRRTVTQGATVMVDVANEGNFKNRWTDRNQLFPEVIFMNTHSVQMDGVNDRIDVAHNSAIDFGRLSTFTLSGWFKSPNTGTKNYMEKMASNRGYRLLDSGGNKVQFEFRGASTTDRIRVETSSVTDMNDGNWHNVCITYDGSGTAAGVKMYIDAAQKGLTTLNDGLVSDPLNSGVFSIGSRSGGGTNFVGNIDEISIWDSALTAIQVAELYNSGFATDLSQHSNTSLKAWWAMDDINYPTVPDTVSGLNGTMINMTPGDVETEVPHG